MGIEINLKASGDQSIPCIGQIYCIYQKVLGESFTLIDVDKITAGGKCHRGAREICSGKYIALQYS